MPRGCSSCPTGRAAVRRPPRGTPLCRPCFLAAVEADVAALVEGAHLFHRGDTVAIGMSGGKDSTALAGILATLNTRRGWGLTLRLLAIDEGIAGYRDDSLASAVATAAALDMPLTVLSYKDLYGWSMDEVVARIGRAGNCTYCGVWRRQALERGAATLDADVLATGHNADDIAETVVMNLLRGDIGRLGRCVDVVTGTPFKYTYEKEIVLYCHYRGLSYFATECVYAPYAFRGGARALVKDLEAVRPAAIVDIIASAEDMCAEAAAAAAADAAAVETRLAAASLAVSAAVAAEPAPSVMAGSPAGAASSSGASGEAADAARPPRGRRRRPATPRVGGGMPQPSPARTVAAPTQTPGSCVRCGFVTSQTVCKACLFTEGLNRGAAVPVAPAER